MIITVASGKGGTGKTTVSTNLAASINESVQLLDCDVEEPNSHIFIKTESTDTKVVTTMIPKVDKEKCSLCGKCEEICQFSAIAVVGETVMTFPEMCHSCKGCVMVCPEDAITESSRELGELKIGQFNNIELIYGQLRIGEAMSPPLIEKVKEKINNEKINNDITTTIIDAPPGTSCPVIVALRKSDFILLVTEPTPFGLNDLKLAVEVVRVLEIPFGIVINRAELKRDLVNQYAEDENIPILLEIPDDRRIAEAYSRGVMIIDELPEFKKIFMQLYEDIKIRNQ